MIEDDFLPICVPENAKEIREQYRKQRERIAEVEAELDTFRDASLLLTGKLEDAQAELTELRKSESKWLRLAQGFERKNEELQAELAALREAITPILDRLLEEQYYSDVGSFGPVIDKLATLLQEEGE